MVEDMEYEPHDTALADDFYVGLDVDDDDDFYDDEEDDYYDDELEVDDDTGDTEFD